MGNKYTSQSAAGYNSTPPSDDGTVSESNKVKWSTIKTKLTDPPKNLADAINTALTVHFDNGPIAVVANATLGATHNGQVIQASGSGVTLTLSDASSLGTGWNCEIVSTDTTNTVSVARATASNTINETSADISLLPLQTIRAIVNAAANGFLIDIKPRHSKAFRTAQSYTFDSTVTNNSTTALNGTTTLTGAALDEAAYVDVASAATTNIGAAASNNVRITGTTTITAFDTVTAGVTRRVRFAAALTLTYNATSLILPTAANITTAADDTAEFTSLGTGNWICTKYIKASGYPVLGRMGKMELLSSATASSSATIDFTGLSSSYDVYKVFGSLVRPATNNTLVRILFSTDGGSTFKAGASDYFDNGSTAAAFISAFGSGASAQLSSAASASCSFEVTLYGMNSTNTFRHMVKSDLVKGDGSTTTTSTSGYGASAANMAAAINAVRFMMSSGNIAEGTFYLYGIKTT